ncbi:pentatricopeptide repeat-containing protein [Quercus suber]|uniref:Pentatricopeptide repeat-containing protein n=1 Tax=Quercus suber TaxID=58331 RepID=A0AAW0K3L4_QUESU
MKEDSCECKDSVFVNAIKTFARAGLLDEAVSLFKSIPQFNCVNRTESFNTLLQILVNESKLIAAHLKSRVRSLNLLMDALCQRGCSVLALQVFLEMNYESYRILMKGLCEERRLNEATHLLYSMFWRISQKGSGEDIVVYRTLLYTLCDNWQVEKAVEILGKILRKGLKAPKRCFHHLDLSQCSTGEDIEGTKRLINEALIRGGIPSLVSYSAMAVDLYNEGKISEANKILIQMQETGFRPTNLIYESKVAALCRGGNVDAAVKVIEEEMEGNCVPNVRAYNIVLKGLCNERKLVLAVEYLKKTAKKLGCNADKETYSILIDGLCCESRYLEASQVLQEMLIKSYWPCVDTYNILIRGLCSVGRQYEAILWLEEMISQGMKPELSVWNLLVASVCSNMTDIEVCSQTFN